jgi:hypothetical protein
MIDERNQQNKMSFAQTSEKRGHLQITTHCCMNKIAAHAAMGLNAQLTLLYEDTVVAVLARPPQPVQSTLNVAKLLLALRLRLRQHHISEQSHQPGDR